MNSGFALGAAAALAWGFADVIVTFYARRIGYLRALVVIHGLSLVPLALLALVVEPPESVTTGSLVSAAALGPVAVVAYMGFYKALELGPISIVSPIVSAFGAVVVLLALLVLGDSLTAVQAFGCGLVLSCVVVASIETSGTDRAGATGIALSLVACLAFGLYLFLQGELADELGWLLPILVSRVVAVLILGALLAAMPGDEPRDKLGLAGVAGCAAVLLAHGCDPTDWVGDSRLPGPVFPLVCVPTTAGTGSEEGGGSEEENSDRRPRAAGERALQEQEPDRTRRENRRQ